MWQKNNALKYIVLLLFNSWPKKSIKDPKNSGEMAVLIFVICSSKQTLLFKHATYV